MTQYPRTTLAVAVLLAAAATAPAQDSLKPLGTWVRHVEGHKITFDVKPDAVRCTITEGGYAISVDADYIVSKDGVLLAIIRTKATAKKDAEENNLEKRLFFCRFSVEKNALVISDLNVGGDKDKVKELVEGRYRKVEGKTSARAVTSSYKPGKAPRSRSGSKVSGFTLPSTRYLEHPPQYLPPEPAPQSSPVTPETRKEGAAPNVLNLLLGSFGLGSVNAYSSDPNRRMQELLSQSEDLRRIEYEWECIWHTDQPSHMTPERVHGGIQ